MVTDHEPEEGQTQDWTRVQAWRRTRRRELLARRQAVPPRRRMAVGNALAELLLNRLPALRSASIGFYWPFRGEINFRHLVTTCLSEGATAALPVVVEKNKPLEFWRWRPGDALSRGIWDIPIPAARVPVQPSILLVPLLGFDEAGYRLGHGGGYYDRTLAAMASRPLAVGVGFEFQRLPTIHPQPHDIPMDLIATEAGLASAEAIGEASRSARYCRRDDRPDIEKFSGTAK